eukprot:g4375.t1
MPGLLNNAVHIRPNLALGSLLAALLAAAPQLSGATLKAKISSDAHLAAGEGHEVFARSADTVQVGDATVAENVEFLTKTLARFQSFASSAQLSIQMRHRKEEQRLKDWAKLRSLGGEAADIHVAAFDDNKVAVVFRDMSKDSGLAFSNAFLNL